MSTCKPDSSRLPVIFQSLTRQGNVAPLSGSPPETKLEDKHPVLQARPGWRLAASQAPSAGTARFRNEGLSQLFVSSDSVEVAQAFR
jgi:hypothetical protein